jgi:hypothetical protein
MYPVGPVDGIFTTAYADKLDVAPLGMVAAVIENDCVDPSNVIPANPVPKVLFAHVGLPVGLREFAPPFVSGQFVVIGDAL